MYYITVSKFKSASFSFLFYFLMYLEIKEMFCCIERNFFHSKISSSPHFPTAFKTLFGLFEYIDRFNYRRQRFFFQTRTKQIEYILFVETLYKWVVCKFKYN